MSSWDVMAQSLSSFLKACHENIATLVGPCLNVLVIYTPHLVLRQRNLINTLRHLQSTSSTAGYAFRPLLLPRPGVDDIKPCEANVRKKIKHEATGDADFDRIQIMLNLPHLSMLLKHMDALQTIVSTSRMPNATPGDMYLVLEDDAMIMDGFLETARAFFAAPRIDEWDILFTGIALSSDVDAALDLRSTRLAMKLLPSKDSYFIRPATAEALLQTLKEDWRFTYRNHLSWFIHSTPSVRSMVLTKRLSIDGSKLGFFTSSANENNGCVFNQDYMELYKMLSASKSELSFERATQHYHSIQHLQCSDVMHIYGVILYRIGHKDAAHQMLEKAIETHKEKHGIFSVRSDMLNNLINMESNETEVPTARSKYENFTFGNGLLSAKK